jgi:hypothetical protein
MPWWAWVGSVVVGFALAAVPLWLAGLGVRVVRQRH